MKKVMRIVAGVPKSLLLSFYYLAMARAIKLPLLVSWNTKIDALGRRDAVQICNNGRVRIGFGGSFALGNRHSYWHVGENAHLSFNGNAYFSRGCQIICDGNMQLGANFTMNSNCILNACNLIKIGDNFLTGWGVEILDGDGHKVKQRGNRSLSCEKIIIGNNVWCAKGVTILKGTEIQDESVCAANAVISSKFNEPHLLIGGFNKIIKRDITWER